MTTMTHLSKNELATILSALDGQPRNPANRDKALAALERKAAALGLTTDEILEAAPGLLDGRLSPADWLAEIDDQGEAKVEAVTAEVVAEVEAGRAAAAEIQAEALAKLPKLTTGERRCLTNIARNLMTPANGAEPRDLDEAGSVWSDSIADGPNQLHRPMIGALIANLSKKGLATSNGEGVALTELGLRAYREMGIFDATPQRDPSRSRFAAKAPAAAPEPAPAPAAPNGTTKEAQLIAMLRRPDGAHLDEIAETFGWQKHTVRGAIAGALKKKLGLAVTSSKDEQGRRTYRIA